MIPDITTTIPSFTIKGNPVHLKGVNLGSWINMEGFMFGLSGTDWQIHSEIKGQFGTEFAEEFFDRYHRSFIAKADIENIAALGFNCVRLPFNWRYFESDAEPFVYRPETFARIDELFNWCEQVGISVLLDFHAAPGGQNTTRPSDNTTGYSQLWGMRHFQDRTVALWEEMARRYGHREALLGYNLLNEPQITQHGELEPPEQKLAMNALFHRLIAAIRAIDPENWIVVEPPVRTSGGVKELDETLFLDPKTALTYHYYPHAKWEKSINYEKDTPPSEQSGELLAFLEDQTTAEHELARKVNRPLLLGEFGVNADKLERCCQLVSGQLALCEKNNVSWTLWSYKDLYRMGLYSPKPETDWYQFTRSTEMLEKEELLQTRFAAFFNELYIGTLGKDDENELIYDAGYGDHVRGAVRMLNNDQVRQLAKWPKEKVALMPEAFLLENCDIKQPYFDVLKPYLQA